MMVQNVKGIPASGNPTPRVSLSADSDRATMTETTGYSGGLVHVKNPRLDLMEEDVLYRLDLGTKTHNLPAAFGDVKEASGCKSAAAAPSPAGSPAPQPAALLPRAGAPLLRVLLSRMGPSCSFVCIGGSPNGMRAFAQFMHKELGLMGAGRTWQTSAWGWPGMPRTGLALSISHGMGIPSISIMFHQLIKPLRHAKRRDVTITRIGTSRGLGMEPRPVVITDTAVDSSFKQRFGPVVPDDVVVRSTGLDKDLAEEPLACSKEIPDFPTPICHTMCTYDFCESKMIFDCPSSPQT